MLHYSSQSTQVGRCLSPRFQAEVKALNHPVSVQAMQPPDMLAYSLKVSRDTQWPFLASYVHTASAST